MVTPKESIVPNIKESQSSTSVFQGSSRKQSSSTCVARKRSFYRSTAELINDLFMSHSEEHVSNATDSLHAQVHPVHRQRQGFSWSEFSGRSGLDFRRKLKHSTVQETGGSSGSPLANADTDVSHKPKITRGVHSTLKQSNSQDETVSCTKDVSYPPQIPVPIFGEITSYPPDTASSALRHTCRGWNINATMESAIHRMPIVRITDADVFEEPKEMATPFEASNSDGIDENDLVNKMASLSLYSGAPNVQYSEPNGNPDLAHKTLMIIFGRVLSYLQLVDRSAIRLTCKGWSDIVTRIWPVSLPSVFYLPNEIIQMVYILLAPIDFNAARRTCRQWLLSSLDQRLLTLMLKRAGCWSSVPLAFQSSVNPEWHLSKVLSLECSLSPNWTGNGFPPHRALNGISKSGRQCAPRNTGFLLAATVDFTALSNGVVIAGAGVISGLLFTASVCGRYVVVAEGCVTYIYRLTSKNAGIQPLSSVFCPARVLAVSMDTSCDRFALAILLDGRMGLVCELRVLKRLKNFNSEMLSPMLMDGSGSRSSRDLDIRERTWPFDDAYQMRTMSEKPQIQKFAPRSRALTALLEGPGIHRESGPQSIYRNLCSNEDPPRSVAVCPSRRCVAFGCAAGVELHWIDSSSRNHLSRWFPLSTPSDFLYFLPSRNENAPSKRLRLISSMAHPYHGPSIKQRFYPSRDEDALQKLTKEIRSHETRETAESIPNGTPDSGNPAVKDHFQAVPLGDSKHVLYTDPATNLVCIGVDTPLGGPTRLQRRISLIGLDGVIPKLYKSCYRLSCGVRVAVGYGDNIWLFSIPNDVFMDMNEGVKDGLWRDYFEPEDEVLGLSIKGKHVGCMRGLVDLSVDFRIDGGLIIWCFSNRGKTGAIKLNDGAASIDSAPKGRVVGLNGMLVDSEKQEKAAETTKLPSQPAAVKLNDKNRKQRVSCESGGRRILSPRLSRHGRKNIRQKSFAYQFRTSTSTLASKKRNISDSSDGATDRYKGRVRLSKDELRGENGEHMYHAAVEDLTCESISSFGEHIDYMDIDGHDEDTLCEHMKAIDLDKDRIDSLCEDLAFCDLNRDTMDFTYDVDNAEMGLPDFEDVEDVDMPDLMVDVGSDLDSDGDITMHNDPWNEASTPFEGFSFASSSNNGHGMYHGQHSGGWLSDALFDGHSPMDLDSDSEQQQMQQPNEFDLLGRFPQGFANGPVANAAEFARLNCELW